MRDDDFIEAESTDYEKSYNEEQYNKKVNSKITKNINSLPYTMLVFIFTLVGMSFLCLALSLVDMDTFSLNSENKYRINFELPNDGSYYDIDLDNYKIVKRRIDSSGNKTKLRSLTGVNTTELKNCLKEITSNEANLTISTSEKNKLFLEHHCYWILKVQTYDNKEYYIKDANQVKKILSLLGERY